MNIPNGSSRANYVFAHDPTPQPALYAPNRSATGIMSHKIQQRMETARFQSRDPFQNTHTNSHRFLVSPSKPFEPQYKPRVMEVSQGRKFQPQSDFQRKLKVRNALKPQFRLKSGSSRPDTPQHLKSRVNGFRMDTAQNSEFSSEGCSICKTQQVAYDVYDQQKKRNWC